MTEHRLIVKIFKEGDVEPIFYDIFPNIETASIETSKFLRKQIYKKWKKDVKNGL